MPDREVGDLLSLAHEDRVHQDDEPVRALTRHCHEGLLDLAGITRPHRLKAYPRGRRLGRSQLSRVAGIGRIPEDGYSRHLGHDFREQLQLLPHQCLRDDGRSRDVSSGPREAGNKSRLHGIDCSCHDDGNGPGRLLGGPSRRQPPYRYDDVNLRLNQVGGQAGKLFVLPLGPSAHDRDVLTFHVANLAERLPKDVERMLDLGVGRRKRREITDAKHSLRRLRGSGGRRRQNACGGHHDEESSSCRHEVSVTHLDRPTLRSAAGAEQREARSAVLRSWAVRGTRPAHTDSYRSGTSTTLPKVVSDATKSYAA